MVSSIRKRMQDGTEEIVKSYQREKDILYMSEAEDPDFFYIEGEDPDF